MLATKLRVATRRDVSTGPDAVTGLIRWYQADTLGLADNTPVGTWPDLSSYAADLTASGAARPTLVQGRWNGKPGVVFHGAQKLASTDQTGRPVSDITVFVVASNYKRGSSPQYVAWSGGSTQGWAIFGSTVTDTDGQPPAFIVRASGAFGNNNAITTLRPGRGDPMILTGWRSGATTKLRVDKGNEVSDSGDTGNIDYTTGAGTIELSLGDKGSSVAPLSGVIFEVLIYAGALSSDEIAQVESYLDEKWRVTLDRSRLLCFFNGQDGTGDYGIGLAWSPDGKRWRRRNANPVITKGSAATWEDEQVKDPWMLWDGSQYVAYYSGFDGSAYRIGRATSPDAITWTKYGSNPVLTLGSSGAFDDSRVLFPVVVVDLDETDSTRLWKMWYGALKASDGKFRIGYATSSDGLSWTKRGQVLDIGAGGAWDDEGVLSGCVYRDGSTWYLLFAGRQGTALPRWQGGVATFTDPEGTYTKSVSNPTLLARFNTAGKSQALTGNTTAGSRTVTVAATADWAAHEPVVLTDTNSTSEPNRILTIDSGTQVTLEWPADAAFATANSAVLRSFAYNSVIPRSVRRLADGSFEAYGVPFQPVDDLTSGSPTLREASQRFTADTVGGDWTYDDVSGHFFMLNDNGRWDNISAENPCVIVRR